MLFAVMPKVNICFTDGAESHSLLLSHGDHTPSPEKCLRIASFAGEGDSPRN